MLIKAKQTRMLAAAHRKSIAINIQQSMFTNVLRICLCIFVIVDTG